MKVSIHIGVAIAFPNFQRNEDNNNNWSNKRSWVSRKGTKANCFSACSKGKKNPTFKDGTTMLLL